MKKANRILCVFLAVILFLTVFGVVTFNADGEDNNNENQGITQESELPTQSDPLTETKPDSQPPTDPIGQPGTDPNMQPPTDPAGQAETEATTAEPTYYEISGNKKIEIEYEKTKKKKLKLKLVCKSKNDNRVLSMVSNPKFTYKSKNNKVVKVNKAGKITVKGYGKTSISVKVSIQGDSKVVAEETISVKVKPLKVKFKVTKVYDRKLGKKVIKLVIKKPKNKSYKYNIQISSNRKFKKNNRGEKTYSAKSLKKDKFRITLNPPKGKNFFAKIRAYKKVYGDWSNPQKYKL
jgi:hypothetical protein